MLLFLTGAFLLLLKGSSSEEDCTADTAGAYYLDSASCSICICECDTNTASTCGYSCDIDWFDTDVSKEYIIDECDITDDCVSFSFANKDSCTCDDVLCDTNESTETPSGTRDDTTKDDDETNDATETPSETTNDQDDNGDGSDNDVTGTPTETDVDDRDDDDEPLQTTSEPQQTKTDENGRTDDDNDDNDNDVKSTSTPNDSDDDGNNNDDGSDSNGRTDKDDYDTNTDDEYEFLNATNVTETIDDSDTTKPYLLAEIKLTVTKIWYDRSDIYAILKRALHLILSNSDDYDSSDSRRYIVKFDASKTDNTRRRNLLNRLLLQDNADDLNNVETTESPKVTDTDVRTNDIKVTEDDSDNDNDNDDDNDKTDIETTSILDTKCDSVDLTLYAGIAVYTSDIDNIEKLYDFIIDLANKFGSDYSLNCENSAIEYRGCGWGDITVLSATMAYYDENGDEVESETFVNTDSGTVDSPAEPSIAANNNYLNGYIFGFMVLMFAFAINL